MTATTGFHHVAAFTADLDRLEAFYCRVFGAGVVFDRVDGPFRHAMIEVGPGSGVHVFERPGHRAESPAADGPISNHFAIGVAELADFHTIRRRAIDRGAGPCDLVDYGIMLACNIVDPDGTSIELCWNRPGVGIDEMTPPRPVAVGG